MSMEVALFGGGCFWCTEAVFSMLKGVSKVEPGYAGGTVPNPTYEQVSTGTTGHAEVIRIEYDPSIVPYRTLLTIFFASHDATQVNRQGHDIGTQYRSVIFPTTPAQRTEAEAFIAELESSSKDGDPIATTLEDAVFYPAETYHKDYFAKNPEQAYCQIVIAPKLQKVQQEYAALLNHTA